MDQLFKALPRDLQWEILTEFMGTHVVRNGKLIRKLVLNIPHQTLKHHIFHINSIYPWHYSKYGTITTNFVVPCFLSECVNILSYVQMLDGGKIMYCVNRNQSYIIFRTATKIVDGREIWDDERFLIEDSVVIEPFVKHVYNSYPFTNKKMRRHA
jgi:hypothetical protein